MNNASAAELFISSATDALFIFCAITAAIFLTRLTHCTYTEDGCHCRPFSCLLLSEFLFSDGVTAGASPSAAALPA